MPGLGAVFTSIEIEDDEVLPGDDNVQVNENVYVTPAGSTLLGSAKYAVLVAKVDDDKPNGAYDCTNEVNDTDFKSIKPFGDESTLHVTLLLNSDGAIILPVSFRLSPGFIFICTRFDEINT